MNTLTINEYLVVKDLNQHDMDNALCHLRTFDAYYRQVEIYYKWYNRFKECADEKFGRKDCEEAYATYCKRASEQRDLCDRNIEWARQQYWLLPDRLGEQRYSRLVDLNMWQYELWH
jgi:hypothetical protein